MSSIDFLTIITVAFLSSFGHCYGMCGGFSLAFLHLNSKEDKVFFLTLVYHLARISAYVFLGLIFGLFGNFLAMSSKIQALSFFALGIFMIFLGFSLIFRTKILFFLENSFLFDNFFKKLMKKAFQFKSFNRAFVLGFCNGFVPCGLVYFFLASVLSQENIVSGILIMLIFGLSTLPSMLFFAKISQLISEFLKNFFNIFSYVLIILYGLHLSYMGFVAFK